MKGPTRREGRRALAARINANGYPIWRPKRRKTKCRCDQCSQGRALRKEPIVEKDPQ